MKGIPHRWDLSPKEARRLQDALASQVILKDRVGEVRSIAGVDVGFDDGGRITRAAVVVLSFPALEQKDHNVITMATCFPYIPGLLSFREVPAILLAMEGLNEKPDLVLCDGQGYAHPRRLGLACHLGLWLGVPTVGVAKSRLIGRYREPGVKKGSRSALMDNGERVGTVLRTRTGVKPVFVSAGHLITLATAVDYVLSSTTKYRLPETTRQADRLASSR
jgi:deoxyribonuclease V